MPIVRGSTPATALVTKRASGVAPDLVTGATHAFGADFAQPAEHMAPRHGEVGTELFVFVAPHPLDEGAPGDDAADHARCRDIVDAQVGSIHTDDRFAEGDRHTDATVAVHAQRRRIEGLERSEHDATDRSPPTRPNQPLLFRGVELAGQFGESHGG